jgi:hypothetical protein
MELFNWFKTFLAEHNNQIADFSSVIDTDTKETLHHFNEQQQQLLTPLIEDGSNSFFAIWSIYPERELEQQPIVWVECESNPTAVCANNFREFLSLLPFGGNLHRYFSRIDFYIIEGRTKEGYLINDFEGDLKDINEKFPEMKKFNAALINELGILAADSPCGLFLNAFDSHPDFYEWINK